MSKRSVRGLSLADLMITFTLFALIGLMSLQVLKYGISSWKHVIGGESANVELARAQHYLSQDLSTASLSNLRINTVPGSHGQAVWFLSAEDEATGEIARDIEGRPFWQRTILYYSVKPDNHDELYKISCAVASGNGAGGIDDRCPHKVLFRKVIDTGNPTTPDLTSQIERLSGWGYIGTNFLTKPDGVRNMSLEPGVQDVKQVARRLLSFSVAQAPDPNYPNEIVVTLTAVAVKSAEREVAVGTVSLTDNRFTTERRFSIYPRNTLE